jgi:pimeloyl-ACP methyl ester carboxylesterase
VAVPTVVVVGAEDDLTPVSDARTIAGLVPEAELVVVEDAAHLPNLEQPVAFNGVMSWLLARVDRAGDRSATSND